jgi:transcriptional regulator with XRE-family HTH domain
MLLIQGKTLADVAEATGKSRTSVMKVARRELRTPDVIEELCRILNATESDLFPEAEFEEKNRATA